MHFPCLQGCVGGMWELCDGSGMVTRFAFALTFTPLFTLVRHWVAVNVRCEQFRCGPQPMNATTTHVPGACLGTIQTTWGHVPTQFTEVFTVWANTTFRS